MTAGTMRFAATGLLALLLLTGCAPAPRQAVDSELSGVLSAEVVAVATTASTGDYAAALQQLDELESKVEASAADEKISASRLVTLQASIERTRASLTTLADAAAAQAAAQESAAQAAAAEAAAAQAAAELAAQQAESDADAGPSEPEPGPGAGKGKDSNKGNGKKG